VGKHKWQLCVFKLLEFAECSHCGHSSGSAVIKSNAAILRSRPRCVSYVSARAASPRALHCVYYPNSKNFIEFGSKLVPHRSNIRRLLQNFGHGAISLHNLFARSKIILIQVNWTPCVPNGWHANNKFLLDFASFGAVLTLTSVLRIFGLREICHWALGALLQSYRLQSYRRLVKP
jgi:hypothetical protein